MPRKPPSRTDEFLASWPATARAVGVLIIFLEMAAGFAGLPVSTPVLAAAGGLLIAPNVASAQARRNAGRYDDEDE